MSYRDTRRSRRLIAGLSALLTGALLASCGIADDEGPSEVSDDARAEGVKTAAANVERLIQPLAEYPEVTGPASMPDMKGKNVWYIPLGTVPIFSSMGLGIEQALDRLGADLTTCDGKFLPTAQVDCMDQAINDGADAVIAGYIDYAAVPSAFEKLVKADVKVLLAGVAPTGGRESDTELAFYDSTQQITDTQGALIDAIIADSDGKGSILYVQISGSNTFDAAFVAVGKQLAERCPGCTLHPLETASGGSDLNKLASAVSSALISHPDVGYVISSTDTVLLETMNGVQRAGQAGKIKVLSANGSLDTLQRIEVGEQFAEIGFSGLHDGWSWVNALARMFADEVPEPNGSAYRLFTADNVGDLELTPAAFNTFAWYGTDAFMDPFLEAWGLDG